MGDFKEVKGVHGADVLQLVIDGCFPSFLSFWWVPIPQSQYPGTGLDNQGKYLLECQSDFSH